MTSRNFPLVAFAFAFVMFPGLLLGGGSSNPILGTFEGPSLTFRHTTQGGVVADEGPQVGVTNLAFYPQHVGVYSGDVSGKWSKKNGRYKLNATAAYNAKLQTLYPTSKVGSKLHINHIKRTNDFLIGDIGVSFEIKTAGVVTALDENGGFVAERQL